MKSTPGGGGGGAGGPRGVGEKGKSAVNPLEGPPGPGVAPSWTNVVNDELGGPQVPGGGTLTRLTIEEPDNSSTTSGNEDAMRLAPATRRSTPGGSAFLLRPKASPKALTSPWLGLGTSLGSQLLSTCKKQPVETSSTKKKRLEQF